MHWFFLLSDQCVTIHKCTLHCTFSTILNSNEWMNELAGWSSTPIHTITTFFLIPSCCMKGEPKLCHFIIAHLIPKHITFHSSFIIVSLSGEFLSHRFSFSFPPQVNLICWLKHKVCFVWSSGITCWWVSDTYGGGKAGWINRLSIWRSLRDVLWTAWLNIAWPEEQEWWVITNTSNK